MLPATQIEQPVLSSREHKHLHKPLCQVQPGSALRGTKLDPNAKKKKISKTYMAKAMSLRHLQRFGCSWVAGRLLSDICWGLMVTQRNTHTVTPCLGTAHMLSR